MVYVTTMQEILGQYTIGILCALAATLTFGITNIIYKRIDSDISILDIVVTRVWVSLPLAYFFAVGSASSLVITVPYETMFPLAISMIFGIVVGDTMYFQSQKRIGVARAFPVVMSYPLVVYLLAALFLGEPVIPQRVLGAIIVVIGVTIISRSEYSIDDEYQDKSKERDRRMGLVFAFLTIAFWALSDVIFQYGVRDVGAAEANYFRMVIASIVFIPIFLISFKGERELPSRSITSIALVSGLIGFGLSLILYSYAIKFVGATITSVIIASAPVVTAPLSAMYLREEVNKRVGVGTVLTILGIFLVVIIF